MRGCLFLCFAIFLSCISLVEGNEDLLSPALFSETRFELPAPYDKGQIIAKARFNESDGGRFVELYSLQVTIGSTPLDIPEPVLELFQGANLSSIQFFIGPPDDPDNPLYSAHPKPNEPAYFVVSYRYGGWAEDSRLSPQDGPTAQIVIREGKIIGLTSWRLDSKGQPHSVDFDPVTLKEIDRTNKAGRDGLAIPIPSATPDAKN